MLTFEQLLEATEIRHRANWDELLKEPYLNTAVQLLHKIVNLKPGSTCLIVGGSVRDILLGIPPADIDIATNVPMEVLIRNFKTHDIGKSKDFGIVVVEYNDQKYEVAQFRSDGTYSDNRRPDSIELVNDFQTDASRRDLTINSMGVDAKGMIHDFNKGIEDLEKQIIRTTGDARTRFTEDAIRILRVARFAGSLGFKIDTATREAMIDLRQLLSNISQERIAGELYKAAKSGPSLARFIEHLADTSILEDILPEVAAFKPFVHSIKHHPEGKGTVLGHVLAALNISRSTVPVVNIGILCHDLGKVVTYKNREGKHTYYGHEQAGVPIVQNIGKRLKLSAEDIETIAFVTANHMHVHNLDKLSIKKLAELINNKNWPALKDVAYADEACRGIDLYSAEAFEYKIATAEEKVAKLSVNGGAGGLKKRIKEFVDGNKIMRWVPELVEPGNKHFISIVLIAVQEYVVEMLHANQPIEEDALIGVARGTFNKLLQ